MDNLIEKLNNSKRNIESANYIIEKIALDIINNKKNKIIGAKEALHVYKRIVKDYEFICRMYFLKGINTLKCDDRVYLRLVLLFANLRNNDMDISNLKNPFVINKVLESDEYKKVKYYD